MDIPFLFTDSTVFFIFVVVVVVVFLFTTKTCNVPNEQLIDCVRFLRITCFLLSIRYNLSDGTKFSSLLYGRSLYKGCTVSQK